MAPTRARACVARESHPVRPNYSLLGFKFFTKLGVSFMTPLHPFWELRLSGRQAQGSHPLTIPPSQVQATHLGTARSRACRASAFWLRLRLDVLLATLVRWDTLCVVLNRREALVGCSGTLRDAPGRSGIWDALRESRTLPNVLKRSGTLLHAQRCPGLLRDALGLLRRA